MSTQEKLTSEEWTTLQIAPIWVFFAVADADGIIDKKEKAAMQKIVMNADNFSSEIAGDVLRSLQPDAEILFQMLKEDTRSVKDGLTDVADILDAKFDEREAVAFKKAMVAIGVYIGEASGGLFQYNFSDEERQALKRAGLYLRISVDQFMRTSAIHEILKKIK